MTGQSKRWNAPASSPSPPPTGALFHFKLVSSLREKALAEVTRGEHYAGGREYARHRGNMAGNFFVEGISRRYVSPSQLLDSA